MECDEEVGRALRRVAEAEGMVAGQAAHLETLQRGGRDTDATELDLAALERALELRRARLEALLSLAEPPQA